MRTKIIYLLLVASISTNAHAIDPLISWGVRNAYINFPDVGQCKEHAPSAELDEELRREAEAAEESILEMNIMKCYGNYWINESAEQHNYDRCGDELEEDSANGHSSYISEHSYNTDIYCNPNFPPQCQNGEFNYYYFKERPVGAFTTIGFDWFDRGTCSKELGNVDILYRLHEVFMVGELEELRAECEREDGGKLVTYAIQNQTYSLSGCTNDWDMKIDASVQGTLVGLCSRKVRCDNT